MKFGSEFTSQMVQEWQEAYMDYNSLKKVLKEIMMFHQNRAPPPAAVLGQTGSLKRRLTMYRAFSGLMKQSDNTKEDEVILVNDEGTNENGSYRTIFLKSSDEGSENELVFFRKLDHEFIKVSKFYKEKVEEVKGEANELSKQMEALIALRIRVEKPRYVEPREAKVGLGTGNLSDPATVFMSVNENRHGRMDAIQEVEMRHESVRPVIKPPTASAGVRLAPLEVLDHVKINVAPDSPVSTLHNVIMSPTSNLSFSKHELRQAEEKMKQAFIDFYQQLRLLKSYCFLNTLAFSKIMKKYDKIASRSASKAYMKMVDKSYLGSSDEVNKLIERLEVSFIKHFANGNHIEGMKYLKPKHKKERHRTTFFIGLLLGGAIALIAGIITAISARNLLKHEGRTQYMDIIFPLYSLFLYIILHMVMFGANTFFWRRYRVNYPFIFGFKSGAGLGFREVFLVASGLAFLTLAAVLSNLDMEMDPRTKSFQTLTELVPLALVIFMFLILFSPFNIVYRSSRYFLIQCVWHCICAPLYKVTLSDFFLADQLTSQVQAFRSLQYYICYYGWGDFRTRTATKCRNSEIYNIFYIVIVIIPFWSRMLQCLRRLSEEKDIKQGFNGLKYFSTIIALIMRTLYELRRELGQATFLKILAASTSGFTTIYNTYWDIVVDWGFLQKGSKNLFLRDKLLISNKAVYYVAIVLNILLRLVWMQLILGITDTPFLHKRAMTAFIACLEILRRGMWNFFRIENEHFNNVGKYRAFKTVPLPFHYER